MNQSGKFRGKGAYLLPNTLTTCALFAGVYSIIAGINGEYESSAIAIGIAGVLDGLDGRVARMTNTQSEFGVQFDSLSDMVSFGLAPALLAYNWSLKSLADISPLAGKLGWLSAFVYIACAALRLARFNAQAGSDDKAFFQGLASPPAALSLAVTVWFFVDQGVSSESVQWLMWVLTASLGILMFSRMRYFSFKSIGAGEKVPIAWIFLLVLILVLFATDPPVVGIMIAISYVGSGVVITLVGRRNRQASRARRKLKQHSIEPEIKRSLKEENDGNG